MRWRGVNDLGMSEGAAPRKNRNLYIADQGTAGFGDRLAVSEQILHIGHNRFTSHPFGMLQILPVRNASGQCRDNDSKSAFGFWAEDYLKSKVSNVELLRLLTHGTD